MTYLVTRCPDLLQHPRAKLSHFSLTEKTLEIIFWSVKIHLNAAPLAVATLLDRPGSPANASTAFTDLISLHRQPATRYFSRLPRGLNVNDHFEPAHGAVVELFQGDIELEHQILGPSRRLPCPHATRAERIPATKEHVEDVHRVA